MSKTIQGSWFFNSALQTPNETIEEFVSFTCVDPHCSLETYNFMRALKVTAGYNSVLLTYHATEIIEALPQEAYDYETSEFVSYALRKITFTREQTVSDEFYEWFTNNATECIAISGSWFFKTGLSTPSSSIDEHVSFTCGSVNFAYPDQNFMHITIFNDAPILSYDNLDDPDAPTQTAYGPGSSYVYSDEGLRYIRFKDTQYVTSDFYDWFTANAEECVAISGAWTFEQLLPEEAGQSVSAKLAIAEFRSNYRSFAGFTFDGGCLYYDGSLSGTICVYDANAWVDEDYRTIDFGTSVEYVSPPVYEWITVNAKFTGSIAGVWTFNDTLNGPIPDQDEYEKFPVDFKVGSKSFTGINYQAPAAVNARLFFDDTPVYDFDNSRWMVNEIYKTVSFGVYAEQQPYRFWTWLCSNATRHESISGTWRINDTLNGTGISGVSVSAYARHIFDESTSEAVYFQADENTATISEVVNDFYDRRMNFGSEPQSVSPKFYAWFIENAAYGTPISGNWKLNDTLLLPDSKLIEQNFEFYGMAFGQGMLYKPAYMKIERVSAEDAGASGIKFTIDGVTYVAEEGMTWADWLASEYNTDDYRSYVCEEDGQIYVVEAEDYVVDNKGNTVASSTPITNGGVYRVEEESEEEQGSVTLGITFTCAGYTATGANFADTALHNRILGFGMIDQIVSFDFYDWLIENAEPYAAVNGTWVLKDDFELPTEGFAQGLYLYGKYRLGDEWVQDPGINGLVTIAGQSSSIALISATYGMSWLYYAGNRDLGCLTDNKFDFGDDLQEVSSEFYNWLYANASFIETAIEDNYQIKGSTLRSIADSIRDRAGLLGELNPVDMPALIRSIPSAGGDVVYQDNSGGGKTMIIT